MTEQRKLAAIMFTDIVGYSNHMSRDEKNALKILSKNRELHREALQKFNGEFIKEIGDGILSIFHSSWDAVCCAMELQHSLNTLSFFQLRIGIHQGDIVVSEKDVFGDGVNIASRIQAICEPGSILISGTVYNDIRNKLGIETDCLGEKQLKNIDRPVIIYSISGDCISQWKADIPETDLREPGLLIQNNKKNRVRSFAKIAALTIAIGVIIVIGVILVRPYILRTFLPYSRIPIAVISFENQTGDTSYGYLQKAIPNLLITNLEQSRLFDVMTWERMQDVIKQLGKGDVKMIDPGLGFDICRKEGCKFIIIGSFIRAGNIFATDAKVLDVETKKIISSVNSKGDNVGSILDTQIDALSKDISHSIGISSRKIANAHMSILDVTTRSLEAYNYFLKGCDAYDKYYWDESIEYFEKALKIDPGFAMAYLYLSRCYFQMGDMHQYKELLEKAYRASHRATENEQLFIHASYAGIIQQNPQMELNLLLELSHKAPRDKRVYFALGIWYKKNEYPDKSINAFKKVLDLDPYNAETYNQLAYQYFNKGDFATAIGYLEKYSALNPDDANPFDSMGDLYWILGDLDKSIEQFKKALEIKHETWYSAAKLAYVYSMKEDYEQVNHWMQVTLDAAATESIKADIFWITAFMDYLYGRVGKAEQSLSKSEAIAKKYKYELFSMGSDFLKAFIYLDMGEFEKAQYRYRSYLPFALASLANDSVPQMNMYYFFQGLVNIKLNRPDSARYYLKRMQPDPRDPDQYFQYQYLMREIQISSAVREQQLDSINRVISRPVPDFVSPWVLIYNLPYMRNSLAEAYHRLGLADKAIAEYERLLTYDPTGKDRRIVNPRYHYYLGVLYQERGDKEKAVDQFRKFLYLLQDADTWFKEKEDAGKRLDRLVIP